MSYQHRDGTCRCDTLPADHNCGPGSDQHCEHGEIRPYGPGKFNTILDSYVYAVSLDGGCDEECGSVSEGGRWYGLMRDGSTIFRDHDPFCEPLNDAERALLTASAGVILTEDDRGFVDVEYFDTKAELERAWERIEAEFAEAPE